MWICRLQHERHDWTVDFDLHSSYFHSPYHPLTYTCVATDCWTKLYEYMWEFCAKVRFKDRWIFVYHSYAMGASPSVADFQEIMSATIDVIRSGECSWQKT